MMTKQPCPGAFSEEVHQLLRKNTDRAQWRTHACTFCGHQVGAQQYLGQWSTEQHWPSVDYEPHNRRATKRHAFILP